MTRERTVKMGAMALLITMIVSDLGDGPVWMQVWRSGTALCLPSGAGVGERGVFSAGAGIHGSMTTLL